MQRFLIFCVFRNTILKVQVACPGFGVDPFEDAETSKQALLLYRVG
jgi:hypothetical protein